MKKFLILLFLSVVLNAQQIEKKEVSPQPDKSNETESIEEKKQDKTKPKKKAPLKIQAASSTYNSKQGLAIFKRDVVVEDDSFYLECDEMHVFYAKATKKKKGGIEKIIAMKNVKIRQHPNTAFADKAVYILNENTITLTGTEKERPVLTGEDGQRMTADVFVVDRITGDVSGNNIAIEAIPTEESEEDDK